jgi:SAM-dependent methyltransferase
MAKGPSTAFRVLGEVHNTLVYTRRIRAIAEAVAPLLPPGVLLDVGCGNGSMGRLLTDLRKDIWVVGLEVLARPRGPAALVLYDGERFPFAPQAFSSVLLADILHHAQEPAAVVRESQRVCHGAILVKDHFCENGWERLVLQVMDWTANAFHGVGSNYRYFRRRDWESLVKALPVRETFRSEEVPGQYPVLLQHWLGRKLQFISRLDCP